MTATFEWETMAEAAFTATEKTDAWHLAVTGAWTLETGLARIDQQLRQFADNAMGRNLEINLSGLENLDTAGAMALQRTMRACSMREEIADQPLYGFSDVNDRHAPLLKEACNHLLPCEVEVDTGNPFLMLLERLGRGVESVAKDTIDILKFVWEVVSGIARIIRHPSRLRLAATVHHMEESGLNATMIVGLMSFLIGAVVAFMGIRILSQFGAEILTVEMIGITVLREFGVLLTAILIAGRSGSAFTAALGSMKLREEIDAMKAMGIDPMEALVIPRTLAMVIMMPALALIAAMLGLIGGALVALSAAEISLNLFFSRMQDVILLQNFFVGLIKAPFFAFFISIIGCYQGMCVEGSAEDLGRRTTMSVVQSLFVVIFLDALFAILFLELGV
ncbi:MAG: ABC transporter permease [Aquisalinus sp.]|nr:ABC transporter permease [Aquisalinus sp.]